MHTNPDQSHGYHSHEVLGQSAGATTSPDIEKPSMLSPENAQIPLLGADAAKLVTFAFASAPGTRFGLKDVSDLFEDHVPASASTLRKRYNDARDELVRHPVFGTQMRTVGHGKSTQVWIVKHAEEDPENVFSSIPKKPASRRAKPIDKGSMQELLDKNAMRARGLSIRDVECITPVEPAATRIVGIYSELVWRTLGDEGIGVFDYLMRNTDKFVLNTDIASSLALEPPKDLEVVENAAEAMKNQKYLARYFIERARASDDGANAQDKALKLSEAIHNALFRELTDIERTMLFRLRAYTGGIALKDLFVAVGRQVPGVSLAHPQPLRQALGKIGAKYGHHVLTTVRPMGNVATEWVQLRPYEPPTRLVKLDK